MKKWSFWVLTAALSLVHGRCFVRDTLEVMERGNPEVDNQGALLFIPVLWLLAASVLASLDVAALVWGARVGREHRFRPGQLGFSGLKGRARAERAAFWLVTAGLVWAAWDLSAGYALSGGALLACLYLWAGAGRA